MLKKTPDRKTAILIYTFTVLITGIIIFFTAVTRPTGATGTISGTVYIDYNMNGVRDTTGTNPNFAVDKGVAGVTVTAYDSGGTARGTATTNAAGAYTLSATGTGPYRLEFTTLPSGYSPSAVGTNNATSVKFVADGNSSANDFGIISQKEYCQNNPDLATTCFTGTIGGTTNDSVLISFPYTSGTTSTANSTGADLPTTHALDVPNNILGAVWGVAYHRRSQKVFTSAFTKRHAGFRNDNQNTASNDPTGEIFISDTTGITASLFLNLNTLFGSNIAGNNPHNVTDYFNDTNAFDAVGKTALGDIDLSEDETTLYVINLSDRKLYGIPLGSGTPTAPVSSSAVSVYNLATLTNPGTGATGCPNDASTPAGQMNRNLRPGGLKVANGRIYVGLTCTAQSTGTVTQLRAFVYELNPAGSGSATQVANFALNYPRSCAATNGTTCAPATWLPWISAPTSLLTYAAYNQRYYPQPWLTDIEFDQNNFMIVGIADRVGHQTGNANGGANTGPVEGVSAGDTLRLSPNASLTSWTLENNGSDGTNTTAGAGTSDGPGGGEFYYQDGYTITGNVHREITLGGLLNVPGYQEIVSSAFDPAPTSTLNGQNTYRAGGIIWLNNNTGTRARSYQLFSIDAPNTFGKASGVGDVEAICDSAPLQIGNRIWNDTNGNGRQDPGENGIQNVAVQIWADTNNDGIVDIQIGTATTDASGNYIFGGPGNTNLSTYTCGSTSSTVDVRVNASSDDAEQTGTTMNLTSGDLDLDGRTNGVRFNNLTIPQGATITSAYIQFTANNTGTVSAGSPAYTIRGQDADNATTFTTGTNNITNRTPTTQSAPWSPGTWTTNSTQNTPDLTSIVQAIVNRSGWSSGNSMAFIVTGGSATAYRTARSWDGLASAAPRLVVNYTVANSCQYKINPTTAYEVRLPATNFNSGQPLNTLAPTTPFNDSTTNGTVRDSNGIVISGSQIIASLTTGDYGQNNHSYDFGFRSAATAFSIGNRVWFDTNDNGIIDGAEVGISGVSVSVFLDANSDGQPDTPASPLGTVTTDASGYYRFDGLSAGNYLVRINPSNFNSGGALRNYANTTGNNTANIDSSGAATNAENGINPAVRNSVQTNGILSNTVTLNASSPTAEPDVPLSGSFAGQGSLDNQSNVTIDLGFYRMCLSGTVWSDTSATGYNDGILNNGEAGIPNVIVALFNSSNVEIPVGVDGILGTADDGPGGMLTNSSGDYNFCGLAPGTYRVTVNTSGGGTSSTPTQINPDNDVDNDDNGFPDNTGNFPLRVISGLIVLTPGGEPVVNNATGTTLNTTVDFGFILAPLLVRLDSFDVYSDTDGTVTVKWTTASEDGNIGFNVYREANGKRELLNASPIAGTALRSPLNLEARSAGYSWTDDSPVSGALYYLEDIDMKGIQTLHGPIAPKIRFSSLDRKANSNLLSDLAKLSKEPAQVDSAERFENSAISNETPKNKSRQFEIAARKGAKIAVKRGGWYRISLSELANAGFDINSNPANWQLFTGGEEIPFGLGADGAVEFYGRGVDTPETDKRIYYLTGGDSAGRRLPAVKSETVEKRNDAASFRNTATIKDRTLYIAGILNGDMENWFGSVIYQTSTRSYNLTALDPAAEGQARLKIKLQGFTIANHNISLRFNQLDLGILSLANYENKTFEFDVPMSAILAGNNQIVLTGLGASGDYTAVDEINLSYERRFIARGNKLNFTVPAGNTVEVGGFDEENVNLVEINNGQAVRRLMVQTAQTENGFGFILEAANYDREFIAFADSQIETPASIVHNAPSRWNSADNKADFIIIAPESFRSSAENLARVRKSESLKTAVVSVEDIYDEFAFGSPTAASIKEFLQTASDSWQIKPKFVLLFGDSSYDMRNYLGQPDRNLVPTKLLDTRVFETSSDAWLADFDDDGIEDIAIGRLPAGTETEAARMIEKITRRTQTENIREQKTNLFVADSGFDANADALRRILPGNVESNVISRSVLNNLQMREEILRQTNNGQSVITYLGHGSTVAWSNSNFFNVNDASVLNNEQLSFYLLMTCLNGYTHDLYSDALAESLIKAEGGAYAVWVSSGATDIAGQMQINRMATELIFNSDNKPLRIGEIVRTAKHTTTDADIRTTWQLIGDPTMFVR